MLTRVPVASGESLPSTVTCTDRPAAMVPSAHETVPAETVHEPAVVDTAAPVTPAGSGSSRVTEVASDGPSSLTVTTYCTGRPATPAR